MDMDLERIWISTEIAMPSLPPSLMQALRPDGCEDAIAVYAQAIAQHPEHVWNYWCLGLAYLLQGDADQAQAVWFSGMMQAENAEWELVQLQTMLQAAADLQLQQYQFALAQSLYEQSLDLGDPIPQVYVDLGRALAQQGLYDEAIDAWQRAIELQPDLLSAYYQQGVTWEKLGETERAISIYQQGLQQQVDGVLSYRLGLCWAQQGQWAQARDCWQQTVQLNPECSPAWGDLGWALGQQGDWSGAIALWQQLAQQLPDLQAVIQTVLDQIEPGRGSVSPEAAVANRRASSTERPSASLSSATGLVLQGAYATTAAWVTASKAISSPADRADAELPHLLPLHAPTVLHLTPPHSLEADLHFSFRLGGEINLPGTFLVTLPNGRFWLSDRQDSTAILTADHQLLGDLSHEFPLLSPNHPDKQAHTHSMFQRSDLPPLEVIEARVVILAGLTNQLYFHWMFDVLPRVEVLRRSGLAWSAIDFAVVSQQTDFQRETLDRLGIPREKILDPSEHPYIQARRLIVPSWPSSPAWMPRWACDFLRREFLSDMALGSTSPPPSKRLYISRPPDATRRVINEPDVLALLSRYGFTALTLETRSVTQQAALLAQAEMVIAPHGGGLTNLVFCQPGTKVLELFGPQFVYPCYWLVSNLMELDYAYLCGSMPEGSYLQQWRYPNPRLADLLVDLEQLEQMLQRLCRS
jgi:capsular polysaccharide biosynthesis protein/tetratricopeptide (TPR) repeat protein